jgi:hypothetical protein
VHVCVCVCVCLCSTRYDLSVGLCVYLCISMFERALVSVICLASD